jgi:hypothetical protein
MRVHESWMIWVLDGVQAYGEANVVSISIGRVALMYLQFSLLITSEAFGEPTNMQDPGVLVKRTRAQSWRWHAPSIQRCHWVLVSGYRDFPQLTKYAMQVIWHFFPLAYEKAP